ncbi:hypothetical protein IV203_021649 [Nitzschia inconspicua]|uniref:Uncharacterized protein n=1 Tax=Nitzschia inconspicua TaxID=303405 RepID=A0A9K3KHR7_9STRA|nr:hypothetical protein IV203_021649 [Nitzschia inconspicua]
MQRPTRNEYPSQHALQEQAIEITMYLELTSSPPSPPTIDHPKKPQIDSLDMSGKMKRGGTNQKPATSILSSSSNSFSPSLTLQFNPIVLVRFVPNLDEITPQEHNDLWYSRAEYKNIRSREQTLMKKISQQAAMERSQHLYFTCRPSMTQRVLGLQTSRERDDRFQNIRKTQLLVLEEQQRLMKNNPEQLAIIYSERSRECAQRARERGMNVEIVLRSLELASLEHNKCHNHLHGERGRSQACWESPPNLSPVMKNQRWSADSSSSTSHSSSPTRGGSSCNGASMLETDKNQSTPMTVVDVPLHITLRQHLRRRQVEENDDELDLPFHPQLPQRRKLDFAAAANSSSPSFS